MQLQLVQQQKIATGVYFIRGFFVTVSDSTVILDQYSNTPSYRIGLLSKRRTCNCFIYDNDLYDNARGFSNFAALVLIDLNYLQL